MRFTIPMIALFAALASCGDASAPAAALAAPAIEGAWRIDKAASRIAFTGTQNGKEFTGRFERFDATILLDPENLETAQIEAVIDTASAKTGDRQRDAALPGADWFSSKAFPTARFVSATIAPTGANAYTATGKLSIRGAERDLTLPFTLTISDGRAVADAAVSLNRSDFGVGQGEDFVTDKWVGYDVGVTIHLEAVR
jgi:polyisoprenoid-binding protein YceI